MCCIPAAEHATPARAQTAQCTNGNCIATCLSPALTQCLTGSGPFCANLQTDPNYCGNCATSCPSDQNNRGTRVCTAGVRNPRCTGFRVYCGCCPSDQNKCGTRRLHGRGVHYTL